MDLPSSRNNSQTEKQYPSESIYSGGIHWWQRVPSFTRNRIARVLNGNIGVGEHSVSN